MSANKASKKVVNKSASFNYLNFSNYRIGRNESWLNSFALSWLIPLVCGELLAKHLLRLPFSPIRALLGLVSLLSSIFLVFVYGFFGFVYLSSSGRT
ncbi:hypothetical protein [Craterilacuibacter sinensis]|uniref:Uncharacterized protein n=1 Tax=Craterilacuibacter sinensis TaxID=2686017 RepID=A0A845BHA6_9NEIS|nr:hypothetical protein [Craterilacuibacter sinensis]MXR36117.1 hypothetical protein [Craterilacuibacter sinensis]